MRTGCRSAHRRECIIHSAHVLGSSCGPRRAGARRRTPPPCRPAALPRAARRAPRARASPHAGASPRAARPGPPAPNAREWREVCLARARERTRLATQRKGRGRRARRAPSASTSRANHTSRAARAPAAPTTPTARTTSAGASRRRAGLRRRGRMTNGCNPKAQTPHRAQRQPRPGQE